MKRGAFFNKITYHLVTKVTTLQRYKALEKIQLYYNLHSNSKQMEIIILLIGISLLIALCFLAAFFWAVSSGQYDDDYTPSVRILFDDKPTKKD